MNVRRFNWPIYAGFLLTLIAFLSYFLVFIWFPITRDFPWANLLIFGIAAALLAVGVRNAFAPERPHPKRSKIFSSILATLSLVVLGLFVLFAFILARQLPASHAAPQVGQKVPDFTLSDTNGKLVSLSELLSSPIKDKTPKGVLLVFYRGYW